MSLFKQLFLIICVVFCCGMYANAQQETTLPFLTRVAQAGYTDLTIIPDQYKTSVSLPVIGGLQVYYNNSAFKFSGLLRTDSRTINPNDVIPDLKNMNYISSGGSIDIVSVRFKTEKIFYQVSMRDVWTQRFNYTKDLANLVWNGNASYAGQTADLNNIRLSLNYYRELALSATKQYNDKLTIGVRGKFLMGVGNITTKQSETSLYTDPNGLAISGNSQVTILTSGVADTDNFKVKQLFGMENLGASVDFGARYAFSDRFSMACNVTNIGFIHWKANVQNYKVNGAYTYTGYVMRDSADVANADWQNVLDTLDAVFKPVQDTKAYNAWLSPTIYLSGNYILNERTSLYGSLASNIYYGYHPTLTVGAVQNVGKTLQATLNYSIMPNNYLNIGGGFVVRGGPIQYYLTCDNIPAIFDPFSVKYFNLRTGINLVFGKVDAKEPVVAR
ncbi:MAG: hypothetical protein H7259_09420 [Cytophagales bacterium]|nr:hypothetical protein [Cytophaga sp.]